MVQALESKDPLTAGHSQRVATRAAALARRLRLPPDLVELVTKGGMLHDLGKIGLPERLLEARAASCSRTSRRSTGSTPCSASASWRRSCPSRAPGRWCASTTSGSTAPATRTA